MSALIYVTHMSNWLIAFGTFWRKHFMKILLAIQVAILFQVIIPRKWFSAFTANKVLLVERSTHSFGHFLRNKLDKNCFK